MVFQIGIQFISIHFIHLLLTWNAVYARKRSIPAVCDGGCLPNIVTLPS